MVGGVLTFALEWAERAGPEDGAHTATGEGGPGGGGVGGGGHTGAPQGQLWGETLLGGGQG